MAGQRRRCRWRKALEDVMVRVPLGQFSGGAHTVIAQHTGAAGTDVYFDFLEIAYPTGNLPAFPAVPATTLATDWDTDAVEFGLAPERAAWLMDTLGFGGRANHYAGALSFYELLNPGLVYASATVTFGGTPEFGKTTTITLGGTPISHLNLWTDTAASIAQCFALSDCGGVLGGMGAGGWGDPHDYGAGCGHERKRAGAEGGCGRQHEVDDDGERRPGGRRGWSLADGSECDAADQPGMPRLDVQLCGGAEGIRHHADGIVQHGVGERGRFDGGGDRAAVSGRDRVPREHPGAADQFFAGQHGILAAGVRGHGGRDGAAGVTPYLQFGEVQWWYFAGDERHAVLRCVTRRRRFRRSMGGPCSTITNPMPTRRSIRRSACSCQGLIGQFCAAVMAYVPGGTRFEVLYPRGHQRYGADETVNFPTAAWTPANLACLKTENFTLRQRATWTQRRQSIAAARRQRGFPPSQSSHLVGISDYTTPWAKESALAIAAGVESVVLFALDQFCLIGYGLPLTSGTSTGSIHGNGARSARACGLAAAGRTPPGLRAAR